MYQKTNDEKKDMCLQRKMYAAGVRPRVWRTATAFEKWPGHDPITLPNGQNPGKTEVRLGSCVGVHLTSGTAVKETDYRQTPTSPAMRWLKLEKRRG